MATEMLRNHYASNTLNTFVKCPGVETLVHVTPLGDCNIYKTMENTTLERDALLHDLNDGRVVQMIPAFVYMAVLMLIGIAGNLMVCYYYGFKTRRTSNTLFIIGLAVFDLITCTVTIPLEIYDVRHFYIFYSVATCKCMRFVNHLASMSSATILLAIAIDRYKRICRPFKKQYNLKDAIRAIVISIAIASFLSWPAFILYTPVEVLVQNDKNITLYGSDCTTTRNNSFVVSMWVFNGIYLFLFVGSVIVLCVLYYLVGKVLLKHGRVRRQYSRPIAADLGQTDSNGTDTSFTTEDMPNDLTENIPEVKTDRINQPKSVYSFKSSNRQNTARPRRSNSGLSTGNNRNSQQIDRKTVKYTIVMLSITATFVISYLPYLVLAIWRVFIGAYEAYVLSDTGFVLFQIGIRSYMLNSAINPFLYGFFNSKFRKFFYRLFCPFCSHDTNNDTTTSSSEGHSRN